MTLNVRMFPCRSDNYGFLIRDEASGLVAAVDTPDAAAILAEIEASGWGRLDLILNTHWHPDHTEGNQALKERFGCWIVGPDEVARVAPLDQAVGDGETVMVGETAFEVTATPGHTLGHVVYRSVEEGAAFVGDTLFALGCGRLFEGTPQQMFDSLRLLAAWPEETVIWCAHEYTASNARFALSLDHDADLKAHADAIFEKRRLGEPTVPTTIADELRFNPFVRAADADAFAAVRAAKDVFSG